MPRPEAERGRLHALIFADPEKTLAAVHHLKREGFEVRDVYSPFPIHGMEDALGLPETRLAYATLIGGLVGGLGKLAFQTWVHVVDWPYNIGGKPDLAFPALVPVTFELAVLFAAFATIGRLFVGRRLWPRWRSERAEDQPHPRVTDDRFAVMVLERDGSFAPGHFRSLCLALGPEELIEGWRVL